MCKTKAEGGARCAAHTRPAFAKVRMALNSLGPADLSDDVPVAAAVAEDAKREAAREKCRAAGFDAFADHASTPSGREEVEAELHEWEYLPLPGQHKANMIGWLRSTLAEGDRRREITKEVEARVKGEQAPTGPAPAAAAASTAPEAAALKAGWTRAASIIDSEADSPSYVRLLREAQPAITAYASTKAGQAEIARFMAWHDASPYDALDLDVWHVLNQSLTEGERVRVSRLSVSERLAEQREAERERRAHTGDGGRFAAAAAPAAPQHAPVVAPKRGLFARLTGRGA